MLFTEKRNCVLGFVSEKHLKHYLNYVSAGPVLYSSSKHIVPVTGKKTLLNLATEKTFSEIYYKDFICLKNVPESELVAEIPDWISFVNTESEFTVLAAIFHPEKRELSLILEDDKQQSKEFLHIIEDKEELVW